MLEIIYIYDSDDTSLINYQLNLTKSTHYNSQYLKILHFDNIIIHSLSEYIDNWKNLEYFYVSHTYWNTWPNNFNKLNKISYLKLTI